MNRIKITFFSLLCFGFLLIHSLAYSQSQQWVSISNDFISVSMDKNTGRYIVYDVVNYQSPKLTNSFFPSNYLMPTALLPVSDRELSPILGFGTNAFNIATFDIDGDAVVFGSLGGQWLGEPTVLPTSIIYAWRIGSLDIIQTVEIITNIDSSFPDAVQISYDIKNNHNKNTRFIETRLVLDPIVNDGAIHPLFLPNSRNVINEHFVSSGSLPEYWIAADQKGELTALALKGVLQAPNILKPSRVYFTTIEKALADPWKYRYNRYNSITNQDNAVVLYYAQKSVYPSTTVRVASTMIAIPSLLDIFDNNGLEVRTSSFTGKNISPASIDLWIENTSTGFFDTVKLQLSVPDTLEIYDKANKSLYNIGQGIATPVNWIIGSKSPSGSGTYDISVSVHGYQNGINTTQFVIPMTVSITSVAPQNTQEELQKAIENTRNMLTPLVSVDTLTNTNTSDTLQIPTTDFYPGDTYGSSTMTLSQIYNLLSTQDNPKNKYLLQLIEKEQQLIQELQETELSIEQIDQQYDILKEVYLRLYKDPSRTDREQINIQELSDNIITLENRLLEQEQNLSNIVNSITQEKISLE